MKVYRMDSKRLNVLDELSLLFGFESIEDVVTRKKIETYILGGFKND